MVDIHDCSLAILPIPDPASISADAWEPFEAAALAVVDRIQPTSPSETRRAAVIDYVQRLIRCNVGCQVFPFGSVPLKTYLPDGDIDLTAFGTTSSDEKLANEVHAVLESEELRKDAEFEVKDVQYIHAEVKLVKCLVQNIVVDISFNQIGGLCTLCFLEQVDERFEKTHLFKRSIMLIKAWCYYESRILGAHHGLISTYALETLVLYILHLFHESLNGPLAVLYRFLDYYSKFDWDNKGISLYGPVSLSSLPELVTDPPDNHDGGFLKREEFLKECAQMFTVPPRNSEKNTQVFFRKFLNIVDPLKQSNNLGRSVSKGNFYRIRSAFDLGARKLGKILQVSANSTADEVNQFFKNTLKRHCTRVRPDVQDIALDFNVERANKDCSPLYSNSFGELSDQFNTISISDSNNHGSLKQKEWNSMAEQKEMKSVSNLVNTHSISMRNGSDFCEAAPSTSGMCSLQSGKGCYAPHLLNESENGKIESHHGMSKKGYTGRSFESHKDGNEFSGNSPALFRHHAYSSVGLVDGSSTCNFNNFTSENSHPVNYCLTPRKDADSNGVQVKELGGDGGTTGDNISDLTGDYIKNLNNLLYAQGCHQDYPMNQDYPVNQLYYQMLAPPHAQYHNKRSPNGHSRKNACGYAGTNGIVPGPCPPGYFVLRPFYQTDDPMRARGTGTYFPDPNLCKDRPPTGRGGRGRNHFPLNNYHRSHRYGRVDRAADMAHSEELRQEPPLQIYLPGANDHGIPSPLKIPVASPSSQAPRDIVHGNGCIHPQDSKVEFGTLGALPSDVRSTSQDQDKPLEVMSTSQDQANRSNSASNSQPSAPASPMSPAQNPGTGSNRMGNSKPYHLKDNGDFPPLSS